MQQNQFVPLSAALAGSVQTHMSHPSQHNTMDGPSFIFPFHVHPAFRMPIFFFLACAHFQLKQTAGLVYNIFLIILMAWILDNGERGGEDSELIVLISPDDHLCVWGGE